MIVENAKSLRGAWRLFRFQDAALREMDVSPEGFRKSWAALLLVIPLNLFGIAALNKVLPEPTPLVPSFIFIILNWLVGVGGVVFFGFLTRQAGKLAATITILNWVSLWANLIFVIPFGLTLLGLPLAVLGIFQLLMLAYFSAVQGFVLWRLWGLNLFLVTGIILSLFLIDRFTNEIFAAVIHTPKTVQVASD